MKKLLLLLVFFCSLSYAQAPLPGIDHNVQETFDNLVERSVTYRPDFLVKLNEAGFTGIHVVDSLANDKLGKFVPIGSKFHVLISKRGLKDLTSMEFTLAHELGHGLGMTHTEPPLPDGSFSWSAEIMSGSGTLDPTHLVYQIMVHPNYAPGIWSRYFSQF